MVLTSASDVKKFKDDSPAANLVQSCGAAWLYGTFAEIENDDYVLRSPTGHHTPLNGR